MDRPEGICEFCNKPTRSYTVTVCNHCYSLKVMMSSNLTKARKILESLEKEIKTKDS